MVDHPAQVVRVGKKHGSGLILLGMYKDSLRARANTNLALL